MIPLGVTNQQRGGVLSFEEVLTSLTPYASYDFQDGYASGDTLTDNTGNGRGLRRNGATTLPNGPAFRSTTSKSCDMFTNASNSHYWKDQATNVVDIAKLATAISVTFSFKYDDITQAFGKVWGWRSSNASNVLSVLTAYPSGTLLGANVSNASGTDLSIGVTNNDTNIHIYTITFGNSICKMYKDGAYVNQVNIGGTTLFNNGADFQFGGNTSLGNAVDMSTDHLSLWTRELSLSEVEDLHNAYMAELL